MSLSKPAWRGIALSVAIAFFLIALRVEVSNATSPRALSLDLFGPGVPQFAHPWWLSLHLFVRKAYSVVAFALVGFTAHRALGPTGRPVLRAAVIVAAYSLAIEIAQRLFVATEPLVESAFDVGCGALGGWLAIYAERMIARHGRATAIRHASHDLDG